MGAKLVNITNGVDGVFIENSRFNTTIISFNCYLPIKKSDIASNALLPYILTSCSEEYEDFTLLNRRFNMLYGADLEVSVDKTGDTQHIKFSVSVINDRFAFDGSSIVLDATDLILSLIFKPRLNGKSFYDEDINREKRKMVENILGEINEKRLYAKNRIIAEMYKGLPYGISKYGELDDVEKLDGSDLYSAWQRLRLNSYIRVQVIGDVLPKDFFDTVAQRFADIPRNPYTDYKAFSTLEPSDTVHYVTDKMNVSQGKLVLGFKSETNGVNCYKFNVMTDIFGGGPYSKLFENVREKMSLCYYCSASPAVTKGHLLVESGVEFDNMERAEKEILNQLIAVQNGDFDDATFEASIKSICGSLKSCNDSLGSLDSWYATRIFTDELVSPDDAIEEISKITKQQVIDTARGIKLHTVYKLIGEGSARDE